MHSFEIKRSRDPIVVNGMCICVCFKPTMCIDNNVEKMIRVVLQLIPTVNEKMLCHGLSVPSSAQEWPCWEGKWFFLIALSVVLEAVPRCGAYPECGIR